MGELDFLLFRLKSALMHLDDVFIHIEYMKNRILQVRIALWSFYEAERALNTKKGFPVKMEKALHSEETNQSLKLQTQ